MIVSSLMLHPKWFQVFQPIWGVSARPLFKAYACNTPSKTIPEKVHRNLVYAIVRPDYMNRVKGLVSTGMLGSAIILYI